MASRTDPRSHVISFRLTPEEAARIDAAASRMAPRRTRNDWCRAAALWLAKAKVPEPVTPKRRPARRQPSADIQLLSRLLAQTGRVSGNVNQLAKVANSTGNLPTAQAIAAVREEIAAIREALLHSLVGGGENDN